MFSLKICNSYGIFGFKKSHIDFMYSIWNILLLQILKICSVATAKFPNKV